MRAERRQAALSARHSTSTSHLPYLYCRNVPSNNEQWTISQRPDPFISLVGSHSCPRTTPQTHPQLSLLTHLPFLIRTELQPARPSLPIDYCTLMEESDPLRRNAIHYNATIPLFYTCTVQQNRDASNIVATRVTHLFYLTPKKHPQHISQRISPHTQLNASPIHLKPGVKPLPQNRAHHAAPPPTQSASLPHTT